VREAAGSPGFPVRVACLWPEALGGILGSVSLSNDGHNYDDSCPRCGGDVELRGSGAIWHDADQPTSWTEDGRCRACGAWLSRPIGPADAPIVAMRALGPWRAGR
jgi:hypothetical protein